MRREARDVVPPLAQRRQAQREDLQPIVEVLSEAALLHLSSRFRFVAVTIRRSRASAWSSRRADLSFLEGAQELRLEGQRRLRDFVEEERPSIGDLEETLLLLVAPVNDPFLWPNSSLSRRLSASAAQFWATKSLSRRRDR
jgi:hypothetical protein